MQARANGSVAITGGAGFIGARLVRALVAAGSPVRVLDRFDGADDPDRKWRRLSPLVASGAVELLVGDVRDRAMVGRLLGTSVAAVVHLAAVGEPVAGDGGDASTCMDVNAIGAAVLLDVAQTTGVGHVILGSSASVYGAGDGSPVAEATAPLPSSVHGVSMRAMELLGRVYAAAAGPRVTAVRIFPTFGSGGSASDLMAGVVRFALDGTEPSPALPTGSCSHVHVDDVVRALRRLLDGRRGDPYREFNLAHPEAIPLDRLLAEVATAFGNLKRRPVPTSTAAPIGLVADVARARDELGFVAEIGIAAGLAELARGGA